MRITKIHIENFRSIRELTLEPGAYCVLIGENNAGKSNILRALNLVLGETWPSERNFCEEDFYNQETSDDIVIQVFFDELWEEWRNKHLMKVGGFELRCHALARKSGKKQRGELSVSYVCITSKGTECQYPAEAGQYKGQFIPLRVSNDSRGRIPFIFIDVLRSYDRQTPATRWSILRKLFNEVNTDFLNDKNLISFENESTGEKVTRKQAFEKTIQKAYSYLRTNNFIEIEKKIAANVLDQMGIDETESAISLRFDGHDPANVYKNMQLYVEQMGITTSASDVGAGLQSSIVVAIFRTYEELKKEGAIFAIEEPEVFLHPQKSRYFQTTLENLANKGNQVFITTHSPIFVQIHEPESVVLITRTKENGTKPRITKQTELADTERKELHLMTEFDSQRNELFFARKVILVEGITEKIALPLVFKLFNVDINKAGISVIECGGKTKLPLFIRVVKALQIPHIVIVDEDIKEIEDSWTEKRKEKQKEKNKQHKIWNEEIEKVSDAQHTFWMKPNFETEADLSHDESKKVEQALAKFTTIKKSDLPKILIDAVELILKSENPSIPKSNKQTAKLTSPLQNVSQATR